MIHFYVYVVLQYFLDYLLHLPRKDRYKIAEFQYILFSRFVEPRGAYPLLNKFGGIRLCSGNKVERRIKLPSYAFEYEHCLIYKEQF